MNLNKTLSIVFIFLFSCPGLSARNTKLDLDKNTLKKVNQLLLETSEFQTALYEQNRDNVKKEILELNMSINMFLREIGDFQVQNQGMHLKRILQSVKNHLESYQNLNSEEKRLSNLKKAFSQLVQLVRIYKVDKSYRIFFCKNDNSEWIQKGWKAKNPIHPNKYGKCGQRAYR